MERWTLEQSKRGLYIRVERGSLLVPCALSGACESRWCAVWGSSGGMPGTPAVDPLVATRVLAGDCFPCGTCGLLFDDRPDLVCHYKGELHRVNLQRKVRDLEPLSHEQFQQREAAQAEAPQDKLEARTQRQEARLEQQLQADGGQAQGPRRRAPLQLASTQCIFSREQFDSLESAVAHMKKQYGFFIPDSEYLTDLRGLMHFLREQVVTHHRCWYCARVGRSYEATVQHMVTRATASCRSMVHILIWRPTTILVRITAPPTPSGCG